jgi:hypothetical protein
MLSDHAALSQSQVETLIWSVAAVRCPASSFVFETLAAEALRASILASLPQLDSDSCTRRSYWPTILPPFPSWDSWGWFAYLPGNLVHVKPAPFLQCDSSDMLWRLLSTEDMTTAGNRAK